MYTGAKTRDSSRLSHINIVQEIIQSFEGKGAATFKIPSDFERENYMLVAFIQKQGFI